MRVELILFITSIINKMLSINWMLQHIFNNNSNINNHKIHLIAVKLKVSKADNVTPKKMKSHKFKQQKKT